MNWVPIVSAAVIGAIGGGVGGLIGRLFKSRNARTFTTVFFAILAIMIGRVFLTPWIEVEYMFRNPTPAVQTLIDMAPDHIGELKALMRDAYSKGGSSQDFKQAGYVWGRKYAGKAFQNVFASKDESLALQSFKEYVRVINDAYNHDPITCYAWIEGIGTPSITKIGLSAYDVKAMVAIIKKANALTAENAPLTGIILTQSMRDALAANVQKNWDNSKLDFPDTSNPTANLPSDRRAKVCYTAVAMFSEIQAMPVPQQLRYLRGIFGH